MALSVLKRLFAATSVMALAVGMATRGHAQEAPATQPPALTPPANAPLRTGIPSGFEDVDTSLRTQFDVVFQDRNVGAFEGTLKDGRFTFADPAAVARALGDAVDPGPVAAFLSQPLAANEQFRCRPGEALAIGCGLLPNGASGVIVNADSFKISLFVPREMLTSRIAAARMLGDPVSGFSLIQNVQMSAATTGSGNGLTYGGTFSTLASYGRNALIGRTTLTDTYGLRSEELYGQRIWATRRAAVGLLQDYQSLTFNSYRMLGGEFGSFYGTLADASFDNATPIEVLLPRRAQVEVYRFGTLVTTGQYEAGLQLIDTRALPDGTYSVQVVARDGGQIILDQTRTFSRSSSAVPPGKTGFRFRAGTRVRDAVFGGPATADSGLFPAATGEVILSAAAQRRFSQTLAGGITISTFDNHPFGEALLELTRGRMAGIVAVGAGANGAYSGLINGSVQFQRFGVYLTARRVRTGSDVSPIFVADRRYRPFLVDQDSIFGSIQAQAFGGAISLNGSYSRSELLDDRYTAAIQYTRSFRLPALGNAMVTASASRSDFDTRFGISVAFFKRVDRKTNASFNTGGQFVANSTAGGGREGFAPVADVTLTRFEQLGGVDVIGEGSLSTDADSDRATARVRAASRVGTGDIAAQWQSRAFGDQTVTYQGNIETGFAMGGGAIRLGLRNPADAMVIVELSKAPPVRSVPDIADGKAADDVAGPAAAVDGDTGKDRRSREPMRRVAEGGYRVVIDGQSNDYVGPGTRTAIGVQPLREYVVALRPEGAPEFDLDATQRRVTLYPGNVVRVKFEAQRVVTIVGRALTQDGRPVVAARIEGGSDIAMSDDSGYFTITAPLAAIVTIRTRGGSMCVQRPINSLIDASQPAILYRSVKIVCDGNVGKIDGAKTSAISDQIQVQEKRKTDHETSTVKVEEEISSARSKGYPSRDGHSANAASSVHVTNLLQIARRDIERLDALLNNRNAA